MSIRRTLSVVTLSFVAASSASADEPIRLSKADTESLVVGKTVHITRARDGAKTRYDFRGDDKVYFTPPNTARNLQISGTYQITERGSVCFKWNPDKYYPMQDGCVMFVRDGAKTTIVSTGDSARVIGEVVE